jgi:hypothetical protein
MRFEYQYLTAPELFDHCSGAGAGRPKHHVVSGTWSGLFPFHAH